MNRRKMHKPISTWLAATVMAPVAIAAAAIAAAWLAGDARAAEPLPGQRVNHEVLALSGGFNLPAGPNLTPAAPYDTPAIDCVNTCPPGCEASWNALQSESAFQQWAQGEYVGRARLPHVPVYRLRVDDAIEFVFRVDRTRIHGQYKLNVGDQVSVESTSDPELTRTLTVLPDGTIMLPLVGQVDAAGVDVSQLRNTLEDRFKKYSDTPGISITPVKINSKLEDLRYTVSGMSGFGEQVYLGRVTPEGTVQLPAVGSVPAQGLTLDEFKSELDERFAEQIEGMEVVPVLREKAPRSVYVLGEVENPGRYSLEAPTTVMQAIAMAGSWTVGAQITHVVVFRRANDWRLLATELDLRDALLGKTPCPADEIWIGDADLIIVPKSKILRADNFIELVFTRGIYGVIPMNFSVTYEPFKGFLPFLPIP
jgi:polysaccharide biosynthesis/export protein